MIYNLFGNDPITVLEKIPINIPSPYTTNGEIKIQLYWKNLSLFKHNLRWCLFFWLFAESNLFSEFRLFVFLFFHDLL